MPRKIIKTWALFYRKDNRASEPWVRKIKQWMKKYYPDIEFCDEKPDALVVLGGDGTILEAAKKYQQKHPLIMGLNLGHVGFLASSRNKKTFLSDLDRFFSGTYTMAKRMMIAAEVRRKGRVVFSTNALNDITAQNMLGIVEIKAEIEGHPFQYIRGTGIMVSTATGSTAFNLSAHGPIVMPNIKCMIVTELLDHNIPTPSIIVKHNKTVELKILDFRKHGLLSDSRSGKKVDVVLVADGAEIFPLEKGDAIKICRSSRLVRFVELEKHYFFKSLQEKFAFK